IAANLERRQIGEQFKLLDVASLPQKPYNQTQRLGVMFSGVGGGLAIAVLFISLMEYRDSSFRCDEEVSKTLSLPVLAMVPTLVSEREFRGARRRRWAIEVAGTVVLLSACAFVMLWRLRS